MLPSMAKTYYDIIKQSAKHSMGGLHAWKIAGPTYRNAFVRTEILYLLTHYEATDGADKLVAMMQELCRLANQDTELL